MEGPLTSRYRPIPHEILLEIFRYTIVPSKLLNYGSTVATHVHVYEQIIIQRESLLLVCQRWYNVAVEVFYREVHLRSVLQTFKFIESLETFGNTSRQFLVKDLIIHAVAPPAEEPTSAGIVNIIRRIFHLCANLSRLSFFPIAPGWSGPIVSSDIELNYSPVLPSALFPSNYCLRELCLGSDALHYLSDYFVHCSHSLEILDLWVASRVVTPALSIQGLEWPRLKWLRCRFYQNGEGANHAQSVEFARSFKTPQLESLTLSWAPYIAGSGALASPFPVSSLIPLVEVNRNRLRYLCMHGFQDQFERGNGVASILKRAPELEHLVIDARLFNVPAPGAHPSLKYIDIWSGCSLTGEDARRAESGGITLDIDENRFPSLKNIRVLDKALLSTAAHVDLPSMIPQGTAEYRFPGFVDIATTSDGKVVYRNDMLNLEHRWDWEKFAQYYNEELRHPDSPMPWYYRGSARLGGEADDNESSSGSEYFSPDSEFSTRSADEYEYASSTDGFFE
ncbi:hypothetical protein PQX77_005094 [Marasmius sp. AFHP31]|nr:hypothetical protein PQX77_005094 [Marasmius sp. AFHP31]